MENIKKVQQGQDPLGVMRDPNHAMIDTKLSESLQSPEAGNRPVIATQIAPAQV
ncbi:MAG: hypothetical protein GTO40_28845 [Deltaproteobacteria bacterium]|nr:hypothetical protein [Deltaproteobacteria bacterium]